MENPWKKIYKGNRSGEKFIVAEADRPYIEEFLDNKKYIPKKNINCISICSHNNSLEIF